MKIDQKINHLPLSKSNPKSLTDLFGHKNVVPMWVADMEFEVAKPIQEALIDRISNSGFGYEYKPDSFLNAQKRWYKNAYNLQLESEHIIYSPSITTSISLIIENTTNKGDGVIIMPPVFMEFRDVIRKTNRKIIKNPLKLENQHYTVDLQDLENKAKLETNRVLILCNPHNPVGRVWRENELKSIINICKKHNVLIISDEIHKDIILFDNAFTSLLHYAEVWQNIVICTSEAKTFNLPGISDSMIIVPDETHRESFKKITRKYNLGATNVLTRVALETAYTMDGTWLKDLIQTIETNVNCIEKELVDSRINLIKPEGTYQVWLDFRDIFEDSKDMFQYITKNSKIGLNAGHWFGREGALFMRMNIASSNEKVLSAIKKVKAAANFI